MLKINRKVPGVTFHKKNDKWESRIQIKGRRLNLGFFDSFDAAVQARRNAERMYRSYNN